MDKVASRAAGNTLSDWQGTLLGAVMPILVVSLCYHTLGISVGNMVLPGVMLLVQGVTVLRMQ